MFQHGDRVKIDRAYLKLEDHKVFPHGFVIEYTAPDKVLVEIMYIGDRIEVAPEALTWEAPRKRKKKS